MGALSAFEIFDLKASFRLDAVALEETYYRLSRELHPDRARGAALKSHLKSAEINQAYLTLRDPEKRLDALLELAGIETGADARSPAPIELAEEFFELQEAAQDAPAASAPKVRAFIERVSRMAEEETRAIHELAARIDWGAPGLGPASADLRRLVERRRARAYLLSMIESARKLVAR